MSGPVTPEALRLYRDLADGLSDMMEGGRLVETAVPDDWAWLNTLVQKIAKADPSPDGKAGDFARHEDDRCRECGDAYEDGGDGWDGMCPSCADAAEDDEPSHQGPDGYECRCTDGRHFEVPDDTPSLDTSFHDHEMNVGGDA